MEATDGWIPNLKIQAFCILNPRRWQMLFRRSKKNRHSLAVEYTLIALLAASAAFQALVVLGAKAHPF
jgi:hypothetical protein